MPRLDGNVTAGAYWRAPGIESLSVAAGRRCSDGNPSQCNRNPRGGHVVSRRGVGNVDDLQAAWPQGKKKAMSGASFLDGARVATRLAAGVAAAVVLVAVGIVAIRIGLTAWIYAASASWAASRLGLDYYSVEFFATTVSTVFALLLPGLAWFLIAGRRRVLGVSVVLGSLALMWVLVYTVGGDVYFDRRTGEPLRYYADTPRGRVFSFTPGFEPRYGVPFRPFTRSVAESESRDETDRKANAQAAEKAREAENSMAREQAAALGAEQDRRQHELKLMGLRAEEARQRADGAAQEAAVIRQEEAARARDAEMARQADEARRIEQAREQKRLELESREARDAERQRLERAELERRENEERRAAADSARRDEQERRARAEADAERRRRAEERERRAERIVRATLDTIERLRRP